MKKFGMFVMAMTGILCFGAQTDPKEETLKLAFINNNSFDQVTRLGEPALWQYNEYSKKFNGGGTFKSEPNGRTGKCIAVKTDAGQSVFFYSANQVDVQPGKDTVKVTLYTKGKGTLQIQLYGYDPKKNCGGWNSPKIQVDSADWQKQEFKIPLTAQPKTVAIRLAPSIFENSDLLIDDLEAVIERNM